jgi:hypothetical protein
MEIEKHLDLLYRMQADVEKRVIANIKVEDNSLKATVVVLQRRLDVNIVDYKIKFSLNGNDYEIEGQTERGKFDEAQTITTKTINAVMLWRAVGVEKIGQAISTMLLREFINQEIENQEKPHPHSIHRPSNNQP